MFVKRKQSWAQNHGHTSWWCFFSQLIGSIETDKNHKIVYNEHFLPARFETFFWLYSVKSQVTTFTYTYHTVNGNNPAPVDMAKVPLFTRFYTGGAGFLLLTVGVKLYDVVTVVSCGIGHGKRWLCAKKKSSNFSMQPCENPQPSCLYVFIGSNFKS